jgi:hypothetical protein
MLVNLKSRLNQIYQDVHQMTKISQLLDYLSLKALSSLAFGLLMILTVLPALVWIFGWVWPAKSFMAGALRQISLMANLAIVDGANRIYWLSGRCNRGRQKLAFRASCQASDPPVLE